MERLVNCSLGVEGGVQKTIGRIIPLASSTQERNMAHRRSELVDSARVKYIYVSRTNISETTIDLYHVYKHSVEMNKGW